MMFINKHRFNFLSYFAQMALLEMNRLKVSRRCYNPDSLLGPRSSMIWSCATCMTDCLDMINSLSCMIIMMMPPAWLSRLQAVFVWCPYQTGRLKQLICIFAFFRLFSRFIVKIPKIRYNWNVVGAHFHFSLGQNEMLFWERFPRPSWSGNNDESVGTIMKACVPTRTA